MGNQNKLREPLIEVVEQSGFAVKKINTKGFRIFGREKNQHIIGYKELIECVMECEIDDLGFGRNRHPVFIDKSRYSENLNLESAKKIAILINNGLGHLLRKTAREVLYADCQDLNITKGRSINYKEETKYREHVVPCIKIVERAAILTAEGFTVEEVANFIRTHLVIILITREEAKYIDIDLGLRDRMPENWSWGDNIFARLDEGNIKYSLDKHA